MHDGGAGGGVIETEDVSKLVQLNVGETPGPRKPALCNRAVVIDDKSLRRIVESHPVHDGEHLVVVVRTADGERAAVIIKFTARIHERDGDAAVEQLTHITTRRSRVGPETEGE